MDNKDFKNHPMYKAAFITLSVISGLTGILLGLQFAQIYSTGEPLMNWWWVFSPVWIPALLFVIGIISLLIFFVREIKRT